MSNVTFSVKSFDPKPSGMDFIDMRLGTEHWGISGRSLITFTSTVEIVDPNNVESNEWELGHHQTVIKMRQSDFYSNPQGQEIYEHLVDTLLTPANDRIDMTSWSWAGWMTSPESFSISNKVITAKAFDQPTCGGRYVTHNKKGNLVRTACKGEFCTWLVARRSNPSSANAKSKGELQWLNWVRWDIDLTSQVDPIHFKLIPAKDAGTKIIKSGGQGTPPPLPPVLDHIWKDNDVWYSLSRGARTLLDKEP
jgi:hypothetical protein